MKYNRNLKQILVFLLFAALALSACVCGLAEGESPALKKIVPDVKAVKIFADAAEPETVTFSASPEGAVISEPVCSSKPEGIIEARWTGENRVEILPLKAGKTTLTVAAGKAKATVSVTVLQPVTSVTLSCDQMPGAGRTLQIRAETEPKNAADKTLEWSVKAGYGTIKIDQNGRLTIPERVAPGTAVTVRCKALGTAGDVEAVLNLTTFVSLPEGYEQAVAVMKQYPLPEALQNLSTEGRDWIPADTVPVLTGIQEVTLEDNELYIVTEKDVANIYVGECSKNGNTWYMDYNSQHDGKIRTKHEARVTIQNAKSHKVIVSVNEYATVRGKRQLVGGTYQLKTNPVRLEPQGSDYQMDLKPEDYPPYTNKTAAYCNLQCEIYPDGRPLRAGYHFDGRQCSFQVYGNFDPKTGKMKECTLNRWYFSGGTDVCAEVKADGNGSLAAVDFQVPSSFAYVFTNGKNDSDIRKRAKTMYHGVDLDAEGIEIWSIDVLEDMNKGWITKTFVCDEPLFTRQEDGSLALNVELKDVKGHDFPYPYLKDFMDSALFSMPCGMK